MIDQLITNVQKYATNIDASPHSVEMLILNRIKPQSVVLEFGPGHGKFTRYLQQEKQCTVYAVEINAQYVEEVRPFCEKILHANIEDYTWLKEFQHIKFDYIIFADVLEHLYSPWQVLTRVKDNCLAHDGRILISIPNIAHSSVILALMNNEFNYTAEGLLDATHIRFFTYKTLNKMFADCGFNISYTTANYIWPSSTEFQSNLDGYALNVMEAIIGREHGNAYQFIYELVDKQQQLVHEVDLVEKCHVTVYYSDGGDFTEDYAARFWAENELSIDLSTHTSLKRLRIDLADYSCCVQLLSCYVKLADGSSKELTPDFHNALHVKEAQFWFINNNDPQLIFNLPQHVAEFYIKWQINALIVTNKGDIVLVNRTDNLNSPALSLLSLCEDLHKQISALNNSLAVKSDDIQQLTSTLDSKNQHIDSLTLSIANSNRQCDELNQALTAKAFEYEQLTSGLAQMQHQRDELNQTLAAKAFEYEQLTSGLAQMQQQLDELKTVIITKDNEIGRLKSTLSSLTLNIANNDRQRDELNQALTAKTLECDERTSNLAQMQHQLDELKTSIITKDNEIGRLKSRLSYRIMARLKRIFKIKSDV